jgi:lipid-A-disaccharide synthase
MTLPLREAARAGDEPLIFLMAGEPSGDALGARLMAALKRETNGKVRFEGIGGERMAGEGLASQFPMAELSIMGVAEIIPSIPRVLRRVSQTVARIRALRPAAVVSIDATGFCFRVERALKRDGIPLVHYVAPMVWAWRPWKARYVAGFLDHMMTLLPFEPPFFERHGLASSFVGHPVLEEGAERGDGPVFRARHGIPAEAPLLVLLPGSRRGETGRLMPVFRETVRLLTRDFPDLRVTIPAVSNLAAELTRQVAGWPVPVTVVEGQAEKYDAFAAADAALAASGTVSLELAIAGTPMVIAYRISPLTALFARPFLARLRYASLVNLLLDREVVPEFLLGRCRPKLLAPAVAVLLRDKAAGRAQIAAAGEALKRLGLKGPPPSVAAARVILKVIAEHPGTVHCVA